MGHWLSSKHDFQGIKAQIDVMSGDPWQAIIQNADHLDADLVVMGSVRHRGIEDTFAGTTLERVADCPCDLLLAPPKRSDP